MCVPCYKQKSHKHKMERLGLDFDGEESSESGSMASPATSRKQSIQRCIQSLVHACQCRNANCRLPSCQSMKKVVAHTRSCKVCTSAAANPTRDHARLLLFVSTTQCGFSAAFLFFLLQKKSPGGCAICKQFVTICCCHAKTCNESKCPVPYCPKIKEKLEQQRKAARKKQAKLLKRRMALMAGSSSQVAANATNGASGAGGTSKLQHSTSQSNTGTYPTEARPPICVVLSRLLTAAVVFSL